jgi:hypothetical protein
MTAVNELTKHKLDLISGEKQNIIHAEHIKKKKYQILGLLNTHFGHMHDQSW